jgi:hypothetical protein
MCGWKVGGPISLAFLSYTLPRASSDGRLAKHINQKLTNLGNAFGDTVCAEDVDESPEKLLALAFTEAEEEAVLNCQHYSIMYRYRNNLVHQARVLVGLQRYWVKSRLKHVTTCM